MLWDRAPCTGQDLSSGLKLDPAQQTRAITELAWDPETLLSFIPEEGNPARLPPPWGGESSSLHKHHPAAEGDSRAARLSATLLPGGAGGGGRC